VGGQDGGLDGVLVQGSAYMGWAFSRELLNGLFFVALRGCFVELASMVGTKYWNLLVESHKSRTKECKVMNAMMKVEQR
jgi:hypothetical protein